MIVRCCYCRKPFKELKQLEYHLGKSHLDIDQNDKQFFLQKALLAFLYQQEKKPITNYHQPKKRAPIVSFYPKKNKIKRLQIYSLRSRKIYEILICDSCHKSTNLLWEYMDTSIGTATICTDCKALFKINRSDIKSKGKGKVKLVYTPFETNRSRH